MTTEVLAVPEDSLLEVVEIIEAGLKAKKNISKDVREGLEHWLSDEREYLKLISAK